MPLWYPPLCSLLMMEGWDHLAIIQDILNMVLKGQGHNIMLFKMKILSELTCNANPNNPSKVHLDSPDLSYENSRHCFIEGCSIHVDGGSDW